MNIDEIVSSVLGMGSFADYEQSTYEKYQEMAEREIIEKLNALLSNPVFLLLLKQWGARCACSFQGYRPITIQLKSGRRWDVLSPVFLRAKPKKKPGRKPKRRKGVLRHIGLEALGIIKRTSPALFEACVSMAVLCPSFEVAAQALRSLGIEMNEHLLQNITHRFAGLIKDVRVECNGEAVWKKSGLKVFV